MYKFSSLSQARLDTCHPLLQEILNEAIQIFDFSVLEGRRERATHEQYIKRGVTRVSYEKTKHRPDKDGYSRAVDVAPYPIDWHDIKRFFILAGIIKTIAWQKGIAIRWGGDWDSDNDFRDQNFNDYVHFELLLDD